MCFLRGSKGDDTLFGEEGNAVIDGYTGADLMIGGNGDDVYVVDHVDDVVDENNTMYGGSGSDTIKSLISLDLSDSTQVLGTVEIFILTGAANINLVGSNNIESIYGNIGNNTLVGNGGDDMLNGRGDADWLFGDTGNDDLFGGAGDDKLYGGIGADKLNGGLGADLMYGGANNDTYVFDNLDDVANELVDGSGGVDTILATINVDLADAGQVKGDVEKVSLQDTGNIDASGNALDNVIQGNTGKNDLDGKLGNDTLTGGDGADRFYFTTKLNASTNRDKISDFVHNSDTIVLENNVFAKLTSTGALSADNLAFNIAVDANDFLIYNTTNGTLSYDADGNGAGNAVAFVTFTGIPGLTQADFEVV